MPKNFLYFHDPHTRFDKPGCQGCPISVYRLDSLNPYSPEDSFPSLGELVSLGIRRGTSTSVKIIHVPVRTFIDISYKKSLEGH